MARKDPIKIYEENQKASKEPACHPQLARQKLAGDHDAPVFSANERHPNMSLEQPSSKNPQVDGRRMVISSLTPACTRPPGRREVAMRIPFPARSFEAAVGMPGRTVVVSEYGFMMVR